MSSFHELAETLKRVQTALRPVVACISWTEIGCVSRERIPSSQYHTRLGQEQQLYVKGILSEA